MAIDTPTKTYTYRFKLIIKQIDDLIGPAQFISDPGCTSALLWTATEFRFREEWYMYMRKPLCGVWLVRKKMRRVSSVRVLFAAWFVPDGFTRKSSKSSVVSGKLEITLSGLLRQFRFFCLILQHFVKEFVKVSWSKF